MEDILDLIPCGFLRLAEGSDGAILRTNATLLAMLGYGAGELEGRGVDAVLSSEARSFWQTDFLPLIALRGEAEEIYLSLLDKQGETVPVLVNAVRRTTDGEAFIDCIFVRRKPRDHDSAMEITGRKQAEERLREHAEILSQVSDAVGMIDNDERILYLNSAGEHLYRVKAADVLGRKLSALYQRRWLKPEDEAAANAMLRERGEAVWELIHVTQDGRELHVQSSVSLMRDAAGTITGIIAAIRDITEQRASNAKLRASEAEFRAVFEQSSVAKAQICAKTRRFLRVNRKFCELIGYSAEELATMTPTDITFAEDRDTDAALVMRFLGDEIPTYENEKRYVRKDGEIVWAQVNATILRDDDGRPERTIAIIQDITERKRAEEALHEMERHYRALAVASSEIAYRMSADWSTLLPLDGRQLVASSDQPLADWAWLDQNLPPEEHPRVRQAISDAIAGKTLFELEHRVRRSDGSIGWTLSRAVPILDENEEVTTWFGAASDITALKQAEEALRENAAVFSTLIAQAPMGTYVLDAQLRMRQINAHAMPAFATVHPLIGRDFQEVVEILWGPEVGGPILRVFRNTLETGERYISPPFTEKRHDLGIEQTYEWETQRVTLPEGQHGVVCYFHEVTERAQATEALRASQERMRLAAEATRVGIWEWNVVTNAIRWDALMFRIYGIEPTPDGFVHYEDWRGAVLPEDLTANEAILQDTVRRAGQSSREFRIRRRSDGECRHIQAVETIRKNAAGQTEWVVGTNLDVTERNLAEKRLRASDERFRIAENASLSFVYEWDVTTGRETRSEGFTKVLGYEADEFPYGGEAWEALIHPDDVPHVRKATVEKPSSDGPSRVEYRLRRKDGEWRSVFDEFMRFWDRDGNLTRVVGSIVDITERKLAEEKIRVSEERLNLLHEITSNSTLGNAARLQSLLRLGCEQFDLENGLVGEVTGDIYKVALGISPGNSIPVGFACPVKDALCDEVLKRNDLLAIENVGGGEWRGHRAHSVFGTEVYFGVPINVDGRVFGTLCFTSPKPRDTAFTRGDHEFLRLLAQTIGTEMTRQQIADKLRQSEAFNRTVLESSPDCVKVLDGEGRLQFMNANGCALMEIDDFAAVRDQPWIALWPSAGESLMHDAVEKAANGETVRFQVFATTAKGTPKWWDVILAPVSSDGERAKSLISVSRDITESKAKQTALERSENRLHRLFETNVVGMIHWNLESSLILDANREFFQMTGYTREDVASGLIDFRKLTPPEWTARNLLRNGRLETRKAFAPFASKASPLLMKRNIFVRTDRGWRSSSQGPDSRIRPPREFRFSSISQSASSSNS